MPGTPSVAGDIYGPFSRPDYTPSSFNVTSGGALKTLIRGRHPALRYLTATSGGVVISSTLNSTKVLVEGQPVILVGSVVNLNTGWSGGVVIGPGALGVSLA